MARFRMCLSRCVLGVGLAASLGVAGAAPANAEPGDVLWRDSYSSSFFSFAHRVLVRSDGQVFVTGQGTDDEYQYDYLTLSYSPDGERLWAKRYHGSSGDDVANDMALGPTEHRLYVTGTRTGLVSAADWATVAYRTDGTRLWVQRYDGPKSDDDAAQAVGVSASTGRIFVTGSSTGKGTGKDIATIAYSPAGDRLWIRRYDGPANGRDGASQLLVGPAGRRIYVVGSSTTGAADKDVTIIAYRGNGTRIWTRRYDGSDGTDTVASAVLGPDGRRIYVAGSSAEDYATIAYRRDGTRIWVDLYDGPAGGTDRASEAALTPDGRTVFVTGTSDGAQDADIATVAYTSSGERVWVERYVNPGIDSATCISVSPDGGQFLVTGSIATVGPIATVAYGFDGDQLWVAGYSGNNEGAGAEDSAVSPDGSSLILTGYERDVYEHLVTLAYSVR